VKKNKLPAIEQLEDEISFALKYIASSLSEEATQRGSMGDLDGHKECLKMAAIALSVWVSIRDLVSFTESLVGVIQEASLALTPEDTDKVLAIAMKGLRDEVQISE